MTPVEGLQDPGNPLNCKMHFSEEISKASLWEVYVLGKKKKGGKELLIQPDLRPRPDLAGSVGQMCIFLGALEPRICMPRPLW